MKECCELCGLRARMHCESDQASLCWDCDEKVHGANFLVAKHSRSLLCHVCNSPTPWKASGPKLTPTVSVCESCVDSHGRKFKKGRDDESQAGNDDDDDGDEDDEVGMFSEDEDEIDDNDDDDEDDDDDDEDEDGENQVVPWSFSSSSSPPPPPMAEASSSSSEEERFLVSKRLRENVDLDSDDEIETGCCSLTNDEATSSNSFRALKKRPRLTTEDALDCNDHDHDQEESRSTAIIASIQRLQKDVITDVDNASATILGICKLSRDQGR